MHLYILSHFRPRTDDLLYNIRTSMKQSSKIDPWHLLARCN